MKGRYGWSWTGGVLHKHLVDVEIPAVAVEASVEGAQHVHHLHGGTEGADGGETHDVGEQDAHSVELLGLNRKSLPQTPGHVPGEDGDQQLHCLPLLLLQGLVSALQRHLGFPQALLQAILSLGLLAHQHHVPQGVVDGDVGHVEATPGQFLQTVHTRRTQEEHSVQLRHEDHLTLQVHVLQGREGATGSYNKMTRGN